MKLVTTITKHILGRSSPVYIEDFQSHNYILHRQRFIAILGQLTTLPKSARLRIRTFDVASSGGRFIEVFW